MSRILVFSGAGASKAVNPDEFPTTVEFFKKLPESIVENRYFQVSLQYLKNEKNLDDVDIEHVLWALEEMHQACLSVSRPNNPAGKLFASNIPNTIVQNRSLSGFSQITSGMKRELNQLIYEINELVYTLYSYDASDKELLDNWVHLIMRFEGVGDSLELFTTNYDTNIESALEIVQGSETAKQWRGISGRMRQYIDSKYWLSNEKRSGRLTKLHGSVNWKRSGSDIMVGDSLFTGDHNKHFIIYPGFKGESVPSELAIFHDYLAEMISQSRKLIFIGFAFRDEYINRIIRESVAPESFVYIINPDESVQFPSRRGKVKYITEYFGKSSINMVPVR